MRKDKGYQQDIHKTWRNKERKNSYAGGTNKSLDDILKEIDEKYDYRIELAKHDYERLAKNPLKEGEDWSKYRIEHCLWEVQVTFNGYEQEIVPLEKALENIENWRQREKGRETYSYQKRTVNKDNQKFVYNGGGYSCHHSVRIPSLKRSNAVWKRFYELFPYYREHYEDLTSVNGLKLKKVW